MASERRVRLLRNGRNRAVRIPKEFEMEGSGAIIRKVENWLGN
jgi:antitoxin VapB